ncbi:hypothetical protein V1264_015805 [Littorina saxatilis]|uniref:Uncharacterized protein n=1 Tax=Littorina saxatilis TaxID=31220 RepID=A0AAN9BML0_9CAEN
MSGSDQSRDSTGRWAPSPSPTPNALRKRRSKQRKLDLLQQRLLSAPISGRSTPEPPSPLSGGSEVQLSLSHPPLRSETPSGLLVGPGGQAGGPVLTDYPPPPGLQGQGPDQLRGQVTEALEAVSALPSTASQLPAASSAALSAACQVLRDAGFLGISSVQSLAAPCVISDLDGLVMSVDRSSPNHGDADPTTSLDRARSISLDESAARAPCSRGAGAGARAAGLDGARAAGLDGARASCFDGAWARCSDGAGARAAGLDGARAAGLDGARAAGLDGARAPCFDGARARAAGLDGAPCFDGARARAAGLDGARAAGLDGARAASLDGARAAGLGGARAAGLVGARAPCSGGARAPGPVWAPARSPCPDGAGARAAALNGATFWDSSRAAPPNGPSARDGSNVAPPHGGHTSQAVTSSVLAGSGFDHPQDFDLGLPSAFREFDDISSEDDLYPDLQPPKVADTSSNSLLSMMSSFKEELFSLRRSVQGQLDSLSSAVRGGGSGSIPSTTHSENPSAPPAPRPGCPPSPPLALFESEEISPEDPSADRSTVTTTFLNLLADKLGDGAFSEGQSSKANARAAFDSMQGGPLSDRRSRLRLTCHPNLRLAWDLVLQSFRSNDSDKTGSTVPPEAQDTAPSFPNPRDPFSFPRMTCKSGGQFAFDASTLPFQHTSKAVGADNEPFRGSAPAVSSFALTPLAFSHLEGVVSDSLQCLSNAWHWSDAAINSTGTVASGSNLRSGFTPLDQVDGNQAGHAFSALRAAMTSQTELLLRLRAQLLALFRDAHLKSSYLSPEERRSLRNTLTTPSALFNPGTVKAVVEQSHKRRQSDFLVGSRTCSAPPPKRHKGNPPKDFRPPATQTSSFQPVRPTRQPESQNFRRPQPVRQKRQKARKPGQKGPQKRQPSSGPF